VLVQFSGLANSTSSHAFIEPLKCALHQVQPYCCGSANCFAWRHPSAPAAFMTDGDAPAADAIALPLAYARVANASTVEHSLTTLRQTMSLMSLREGPLYLCVLETSFADLVSGGVAEAGFLLTPTRGRPFETFVGFLAAALPARFAVIRLSAC
jgi:hypothetical protein